MGQVRLTYEESFAVTPEVLWAALADHEGMAKWTGMRVSVVAGPPDGGVGTVRRMSMRGLTFDEEVVYADPPRRMAYRIVRGIPLLRFHRGEILIEPWGRTGSQLRWDILVESAVPGLAHAIAAPLRPGLRKALSNLRAQLAAKSEPSLRDSASRAS